MKGASDPLHYFTAFYENIIGSIPIFSQWLNCSSLTPKPATLINSIFSLPNQKGLFSLFLFLFPSLSEILLFHQAKWPLKKQGQTTLQITYWTG